MSVSPMKKLTAAVMKQDADNLVRTLMWMKCVEVTRVDSDGEIAPSSYDAECTETAIVVKKLEKAIKTLMSRASPQVVRQTGMFTPKPVKQRGDYDLSSANYIDAYSDMERVEEIDYRLAELENDRTAHMSSKAVLTPWKDCPIPLETRRTKETKFMFGTLPAAVSVEQAYADLNGLLCAVECFGADSQVSYIVVASYATDENPAYSALTKLGFTRIDLREYNGSASVNLSRLEREIERIDAEYAGLQNELREISNRLPAIRMAYDYTSTRLEQMLAKQKLYETRETVLLTGWVPTKAVPDLTAELDKLCASYGFDEPTDEDTVPILLNNPPPSNAFEGVVGMYSMPKYGTFDPTLIMSFFYFVIFGFMLADVIDGLLLIIGGAILYKKANLGSGAKGLVKMFMICGISCTVTGLLFGSYLGDLPAVFAENMLGISLPSFAIWFDPIQNPILFLVLSLVIGAVHLVTGIAIQFGILWKEGKRFEAIFDQGSWIVLFVGVALAALGMMTAGVITACSGALMLICTQGRAQKNIFMKIIMGIGSLYGIMNYVSDLLSYSRIMALGLSSAVVASVMNLLATLIGPSIAGYIAMIIILAVGHGLNLAINLLGSFVHTSRLQYIEFFGKFFVDGGKPFKPVQPQLKYTGVNE